MSEKMKNYLQTIGLVLGTLVVLAGAAKWMGIGITGPGQALEQHVEVSEAVHDSFRTEDDTLHTEILQMQENSKTLVRRICIRDTYEELMAQYMLVECEKLGVPRRPGDMGAREALAAGRPEAVPAMSMPPPDTVELDSIP